MTKGTRLTLFWLSTFSFLSSSFLLISLIVSQMWGKHFATKANLKKIFICLLFIKIWISWARHLVAFVAIWYLEQRWSCSLTVGSGILGSCNEWLAGTLCLLSVQYTASCFWWVYNFLPSEAAIMYTERVSGLFFPDNPSNPESLYDFSKWPAEILQW